jgi:hypothetical protein
MYTRMRTKRGTMYSQTRDSVDTATGEVVAHPDQHELFPSEPPSYQQLAEAYEAVESAKVEWDDLKEETKEAQARYERRRGELANLHLQLRRALTRRQ